MRKNTSSVNREATKNVLFFMIQPPGSNGAQANLHRKLISPLVSCGWQCHFIGPDPRFASVHTEFVPDADEICHYVKYAPLSKRFSILRHRTPRSNLLLQGVYGCIQLAARAYERALNLDSTIEYVEAMLEEASSLVENTRIDLIAGVCPEFKIFHAASDFARQRKIPFLGVFHDPYGARAEDGFIPNEFDKQRSAIEVGKHTVFLSPLTRSRYVQCGLTSEETSTYVTDSFEQVGGIETQLSTAERKSKQSAVKFVHLGNLATWRPIGNFLNAWMKVSEQLDQKLHLDHFGLIDPETENKIKGHHFLKQSIVLKSACSLGESHRHAESSDVLLVVIGPRHADNLPSKFFEYLSHKKPIFVVGPVGNPIEEIIRELKIGVYCDVTSETSIYDGLEEIVENYIKIKKNYDVNQALLDKYRSSEVAKKWAIAFDEAC